MLHKPGLGQATPLELQMAKLPLLPHSGEGDERNMLQEGDTPEVYDSATCFWGSGTEGSVNNDHD